MSVNTSSQEYIVSTQNQMVEPKPANRCFHTECKRKLLLSDTTCKCNERFCMSHRMPELHNCTFDFKADGRTQLETALKKVTGNKFERI